MTRRAACRVLGLAIGAAAISVSWPASAGDIRISGTNCAAAVHLVVRDARLSDVLRELAKALHFELVGGADSDTPLSVDVTRRPVDLVAGLAGIENISMALENNPRCPARERIVKLWVLPRKDGAAPAHANAAQAAQSRREQEGIDMVLRAHGAPTSGAQNAKPR
jgi:hypothetical protein